MIGEVMKMDTDEVIKQAKKFLKDNRDELPPKLKGRFEVVDGQVVPLDEMGRRELEKK
jgi:hypothetical protein